MAKRPWKVTTTPIEPQKKLLCDVVIVSGAAGSAMLMLPVEHESLLARFGDAWMRRYVDNECEKHHRGVVIGDASEEEVWKGALGRKRLAVLNENQQ